MGGVAIDLYRKGSDGDHMSDMDKAAIVAELERLASDWHQRSLQDARSALIAPHAFSSGIFSGLSLSLKVVHAGGALPPESEEKVEGN
jgi:hypothetical protein